MGWKKTDFCRSDNLAGRQQVLQAHCPDSVCIQFDDIKNLKVADLRDVLTKRQIIYVYHNQIDARGDKANTEDEVFNACEEAIQKMMDLIHRISISGNTYHFIVTADHGFQVCLDSGAKKVLLPITSAADPGTVQPELVGSFNLIFYGL